MKIRDLGSLSGEVWLFGGAYSNLQATGALLAAAGRHAIPGARLICTGDLVGYCASPAEVLAAVKASGAAVIAGNVERQLAVGAPDCGCGFSPGSACARLSQSWFAHADARVDAGWRNWMQALPDLAIFAHEGRRYAVVHGGLSDIARFLWPDTPEVAFVQEITAIIAAAGPVHGIIAGHCGVAFERMVQGVSWINAGAIGLPPHDARPMTRYASLRADGARFHRLSYDHQAAIAAMRTAGLVQGYEQTLEGGLWPSEDMLPAQMKRPEAL